MLSPFQSHDALLADIADAAAVRDSLHLWWLGQSGFLIQWDGRYLLLDPYLSDSLTAKYAGTDKPHIRMTEICIRPERLDFIDGVTSSHNHTDHFDPETLGPILAASPATAIVVPEANRRLAAERLSLAEDRFLGHDAGRMLDVAGFTIAGVPAAHDILERDDAGHHRYLGYVIGCGPWTIYHSGDTRLYDGMVEMLRPHKIDIALLPINGHAPERRVAGNLSGREAARLAFDVGAGVAIPCHYDTFTFNTATPEEFSQEAEKLGQKIAILKCGERFTPPYR